MVLENVSIGRSKIMKKVGMDAFEICGKYKFMNDYEMNWQYCFWNMCHYVK